MPKTSLYLELYHIREREREMYNSYSKEVICENGKEKKRLKFTCILTVLSESSPEMDEKSKIHIGWLYVLSAHVLCPKNHLSQLCFIQVNIFFFGFVHGFFLFILNIYNYLTCLLL